MKTKKLKCYEITGLKIAENYSTERWKTLTFAYDLEGAIFKARKICLQHNVMNMNVKEYKFNTESK